MAMTPTNPTDPTAIEAALRANYSTLGLTPGAPGSGATDLSYYAQQIANTGGLTPQNSAYWFGAGGRIAMDAQKGGSGGAMKAPTAGVINVGAPSPLAPPNLGMTQNAFAPPSPIVPISSLMGGQGQGY